MISKTKKRVIIVIIILLISVIGGWAFFWAKKTKYNDAQKALEENRLTDAKEAFLSLSDYEDSELYVRYIDARNELKAGNYGNASSLFRKLDGFLDSSIQAENADEKEKAALYSRALSALSRVEYEEAIQLLDKTVGYQDTSKYQIYAHAMKMGEQGNFETAISTFSNLGSFSDSDLQVRYYQARELESNQNYEEAEKLYLTIATFRDSQKRIDDIPNLICARRLEEACKLAEAGELENAIEQMKLLVSEGFEPAKIELYKCYTLLGDMKTDDLSEAYKLYSLGENEGKKKEIEEQYLAAQSLFESGDYEGAAQVFAHLNTYADSQDRRLESMYYLGVEELNEGHWNSAERIFIDLGTYRDSEIKVLESRYGKAKEYAMSSDWEAAEEAYLSAGEISDSIERAKEAAYKQGRTHFENGKMMKAIECFERAQGYDDAKVYIARISYSRGIESLSNGNYDEAREYFRKADDYADAKLKILESWYLEGQRYFEGKSYGEAIDYFKRAGEYGDAKVFINFAEYNRAVSLLQEGQWEEASNIFANLEKQGYADAGMKRKQADYSRAMEALDNQKWAEARERFEALGDYEDAAKASKYAAAQSLLSTGADGEAYKMLLAVADYRDATSILQTDRMKNIDTYEVSMTSIGLKIRFPYDWIALTTDSPESEYENFEFSREDFLVFMKQEGKDENGLCCYAFDNNNREFTIEKISDVGTTKSVRDFALEMGEIGFVQALEEFFSDNGVKNILGANFEEINNNSYIIFHGAENNENLVLAITFVSGTGYLYELHSEAGILSDTQIPFMREVLSSIIYDQP